MAYTTIDDPGLFFNTLTTTGTGSSQAVTGLGFQPDWIWGKRTDSTGHHTLFDSVRGITKGLETTSSGAEFTSTDYYSAFGSDGFTIAAGAAGTGNGDSQTGVHWCWKAGTSFTNDASSTGVGTIDSTGSVSSDSGFSIVSFDLSGQSGNETIKHGLNTAPKVVITKRRSGGAGDWTSYFGAIGNTYLVLSSTNAGATSTSFMNNTAPTSSVFTVGDPSWWGADPFIAYCFADVKGYSKFGSYIGNANADGTFIYTGFKPSLFIWKRTDASTSWGMIDNKRDTINVMGKQLFPNSNSAEASYTILDFCSNGIKMRNTFSDTNNGSFIYMAFAESPFVNSKGVPNNAR